MGDEYSIGCSIWIVLDTVLLNHKFWKQRAIVYHLIIVAFVFCQKETTDVYQLLYWVSRSTSKTARTKRQLLGLYFGYNI